MRSCIQWHEGMLMSPQHFQQSESYFQNVTSQICSAIFPFGYGIFELKFDTSSLASGLIRILKAQGIFQDGLFFDYDAAKDGPLELNLGEYFSTNTAAVKIYLAIPARRQGENMLEGDLARYRSSEILNVGDENTGDNQINIPVLTPNLKLLRESQADGRYVGFPVCEVEKSVEGGIVSTSFIAPFMTLDEHSKIIDMCRDVTRMLREKISYFADRKENFARNQVTESMTNLRLLIQAALPLESIIKTKKIHPFEVFKYLLRTAADIAAINPAQLIPRLPVYDHNNLFQSFRQICDYVKGIVSKLKQEYDIVQFTREDSEFFLQMHPDWLNKDEIAIGIQKPFSLSENDILDWIGGLQIASESMMHAIKNRRILGAERRILERGEYITQPSGMTIIAVKTQTAYIRPNERLYLTSTVRGIMPEEVILYADR